MKYQLPDHDSGTTYEPVAFWFDELDEGGFPDFTGVLIEMSVRKTEDTASVLDFSTTDGTIYVTDVALRKFELRPGEAVVSESYKYLYDIKITFNDDTVAPKYIKGEWQINRGITR